MTARTEMISNTFIWRRVHSLMGLWLVLYLMVHLIVNSQAALWLGEDGIGFIDLVNLLEALPYLQVIETVWIGIPLVIHGYWGIKRALTAKNNSGGSDGSSPSLPYGRNRSFKWQRITSWILLVGIIGHVLQMRFIHFPQKVSVGSEIAYVVPLKDDPGLDSLSERIHVKLVKEGDFVMASAPTPGKAMLLMVRETFKSPLMCVLYSVFVLAAAFHAFNGFWTSLITWGAALSYRSQKAFIPICWVGVGLLAFLGLAAIWGSYWLNLRN
jgi:succinate dehydrogenase / fumarate reductase, cytochrome b subunit